MTYAIRKRTKKGKKGYQVVEFMLPTYFTNNGYPAIENDVKGGWFEDRNDAESHALDLEWEDEDN